MPTYRRNRTAIWIRGTVCSCRLEAPASKNSRSNPVTNIPAAMGNPGMYLSVKEFFFS